VNPSGKPRHLIHGKFCYRDWLLKGCRDGIWYRFAMQVRFGNFVHPDTCDETVRSFCVVDKCQPEKGK
jgi:hypothetical protein